MAIREARYHDSYDDSADDPRDKDLRNRKVIVTKIIAETSQ